MELYHNDSFIEVLHDETFWVAVAFFIYVVSLTDLVYLLISYFTKHY